MKLVLILIMLSVTGCATMTDYNKGCRDGIKSLNKDINPQLLEFHCDYLDSLFSRTDMPNRSEK